MRKLVADLALHLKAFLLLGHEIEQGERAVPYAMDLEQLLALGRREIEIRGDEIGEVREIGHARDDFLKSRRIRGKQLENLERKLLQPLEQRRARLAALLALIESVAPREAAPLESSAFFAHVLQAKARDSARDDLEAAAFSAPLALDLRQGADAIDVARLRFLRFGVGFL